LAEQPPEECKIAHAEKAFRNSWDLRPVRVGLRCCNRFRRTGQPWDKPGHDAL